MNRLSVRQLLQQALLEDIGPRDITTELLFDADAEIQAVLIAKAAGRIAGLLVVEEIFRLLDDRVRLIPLVAEGSDVDAGVSLATIRGSARAVLSAERVALNLLQRMSGIATATRDVVRLTAPYRVQIADTRKTSPGLRLLDKYAVALGGGVNHRFGLYDAVLIKDTHIAAVGSITEAVRRIRQGIGHVTKIQVEVETLEQVKEALALDIDALLLDNMAPDTLRQAVALARGRVVTEASGGITPDNIREYAATGVDVISLGWLTHSVKALDISLKVDSQITK
ncbi:MAG: nicotinate-nucleotide diphosphorylase (carboxylating) [Bacillaceae bacterium G1]|nr:MAG: nicotinate-nucleotide diphosphorylase (carboxylating) [Bacillaceae bacterium G1]